MSLDRVPGTTPTTASIGHLTACPIVTPEMFKEESRLPSQEGVAS
jgi:hypothetical protein